jgi:hypothetical protein
MRMTRVKLRELEGGMTSQIAATAHRFDGPAKAMGPAVAAMPGNMV